MTSPKKRGFAERAPRVRLAKEARRAELLRLGQVAFRARAYDEVSIDAIAEAAGISKGLVYHYFPTKSALYAATVRQAASELLRSTEIDEADGAPIERARAALDAYFAYVAMHGRAYAALLRSGVAADPAVARIVEDTRAAFLARLVTGLPKGERRKRSMRAALRGFVGFVEGMSLELAQSPRLDRIRLRDLALRVLGQIVARA